MRLSRPIWNLALIGFMGTGKSSLGRFIAGQLGLVFVDTDEWIETRARKTISAIFAEQGEAGFRTLENEMARDLETRRHCVIATGGGFPVHSDNLARLKRHSLVACLWAPPEIIWERVRHQTHRPLLQDADPLARIRSLLEERKPIYAQADLIVGTSARPIRDVADHVIRHFQLHLRPPTNGHPQVREHP